ncbi:MAG: matrixin family metalloprotease [Actinomycetota bacterium]|nr:matrixin family metalloprotease [Actinomycetota bacterium]
MTTSEPPAGIDRRDPQHPLRRAHDYADSGQRTRTWTRPERRFRLSYRRSPIATVVCSLLVLISSSAVAYGTTRVGSIYSDETFAGSGWATCSTPISFTTDTSNLPKSVAAKIRPDLAAAFDAWAQGSGYTFVDNGELPVVFNDSSSSVTTASDLGRNIAVHFVPNAHSTMITSEVVGFASPNKVFADTKEIVGGYMVLSSDYVKVVDPVHRRALFMHELGHALGLAHSEDPGNVMYKYMHNNATLASGDIAGIRAIEKVCAS